MSASRTAHRLVHSWVDRGVTEAVLAPGSRSGPLALALHAADAAGRLRLHVRVDEREAGFLALGLAKVSRGVVPVVTTSGTAVANLHPAMLEARHTGVGVLAVTADRPARLRGTGANQTTHQPGIFPGIAFTDRADAWATVARPGTPGHLNLELDEPLLEVVPWEEPTDGRGDASDEPAEAPREALDLDPAPRTVVLAGDDAGPRARILARDAGWPLLAEPTSGARTGQALPAYRLLLAHEPLAGRVQRVVSFGHPTLSRPVTALLGRPDVEVVHVGDQSTFPVPARPNVTFTHDVVAAGTGEPAWLTAWTQADAQVRAALEPLLDGTTGLDVARTVATALPPGGLLLVGASQPVRDLDLVAPAWPVGERRLVVANRGLAGIDGTLSTAIGAALARDSSRALALVGDLTFLHGSNGLLVGPDEPRPDLTVVVLNDDGGAIFATLEQGGPEHAEAFERVFGTPTGADLGALCRGYGVPHRRVPPSGLAAALREPPRGIEVVEVPVDRSGRRALDRRSRELAHDVLSAGRPAS